MLGWEWYGDTNVVRVFLHCLLKANYTEKRWCGVVIGRGQFITSVATMAQELHLSAQQVRTALCKLKSTNEITIKTTNKYTIVSVCNYDTYQAKETPSQQAEQQTTEQTDNEQVTNEQQTNNNNIIHIDSTHSLDPSDIHTTPYGVKDGASPSNTQGKKGKFDFKGYLLERGVSEQAANDWIEVRKKKRSANTLTAIKLIESQAEKAGISLAAAVEICAGNSWQSLKAEWIADKPTAQPEESDYIKAMNAQVREQKEHDAIIDAERQRRRSIGLLTSGISNK